MTSKFSNSTGVVDELVIINLIMYIYIYLFNYLTLSTVNDTKNTFYNLNINYYKTSNC